MGVFIYTDGLGNRIIVLKFMEIKKILKFCLNV